MHASRIDRNDAHRQIDSRKPGMSDHETLVSVIVGVCQRDPERWREFDAIYRPILNSFLRKRGLGEFEVNDVVQDIYVKLLARIHTYDRARCRFRTWLFSVAQRTLIDSARREARLKTAVDGWVANVLRETPTDSVKLEQEWTELHRKQIVEYAIKTVRTRVSSRAWACFEQRLLRDRPADRIACDLGLSCHAVYVNTCRVLKLVRAFCEQFDEEL
jgi:RNA polymerase sigma-70 factor (ECF subfamily)